MMIERVADRRNVDTFHINDGRCNARLLVTAVNYSACYDRDNSKSMSKLLTTNYLEPQRPTCILIINNESKCIFDALILVLEGHEALSLDNKARRSVKFL